MSPLPSQLPLFPLRTVLFPGMNLPLRIFEQRYRELIGWCLENQSPFGVVLIRWGTEVGAPATPFSFGTVAHITQSQKLYDGRYTITARGEERFRVTEIIERQPYMIATIEEVFDDEPVDPALAEQVHESFKQYLKTFVGFQTGWAKDMHMPSDAGALSYFVAHNLGIKLVEKQALLELSTVERLKRELNHLRVAHERLTGEVDWTSRYLQGPSLN